MRLLLTIFIFTLALNTSAQIASEPLMPWPKEVVFNEGKFLINKNFTVGIRGAFNDRLYDAANRFLRRLDNRTGVFFKQGIINKHSVFSDAPSLLIKVVRPGEIKLHEDESYQLTINNQKIILTATTDIGAIRGLETLLQLQKSNESSYFFPATVINDAPRFAWRGLMIDVARHFMPTHIIKRNLDAMAALKLNVFHWHLSDDQGFRVKINSRPKLHELASDGLYYTQEQIKEIVSYAHNRGIMVIPEIDVPGHATAILTAYPELASKDTIYTLERNAGIFNPTLNPIKEEVYVFLEDVFKELSQLFPHEYVHIGGDENEGKHWDENPEILAFKKQKGISSNHELQVYFNVRVAKILNKYGKKIMGWEEIMDIQMPKSTIIHSWRGSNEGLPAKQSLVNAVKKGYKVVLSNGYYIDLMYPAASHYKVDPLPETPLSTKEKQLILGGEATMWSELVTPVTIDSRIWPRTAAIAERFWSEQLITDVDNMYNRLKTVSYRLEEVGITHYRNRDVLLRNLTENQNTEALRTLVTVCEPLKQYTRNKGGTEYKSYSPFTLFADACSADASAVRPFNKSVKLFLETDNATIVLGYLSVWEENHKKFTALQTNPKLAKLQTLSEQLSIVSAVLAHVIKTKKMSEKELKIIQSTLQKLSQPFEDTELAVLPDLKLLSDYVIKNYLLP